MSQACCSTQVHETLEASTSGREITKDMVLRSIERQSNARRPSNADAEEKFLLKQTHLHLNGHSICKISGLRCVPKVEVLYLYDNHIQMIENIHFLHNLRLLYLQNNNITHITGLDDLKGLSKLYLDNNCIQVRLGSAQPCCSSTVAREVAMQPPQTTSPCLYVGGASRCSICSRMCTLLAVHSVTGAFP